MLFFAVVTSNFNFNSLNLSLLQLVQTLSHTYVCTHTHTHSQRYGSVHWGRIGFLREYWRLFIFISSHTLTSSSFYPTLSLLSYTLCLTLCYLCSISRFHKGTCTHSFQFQSYSALCLSHSRLHFFLLTLSPFVSVAHIQLRSLYFLHVSVCLPALCLNPVVCGLASNGVLSPFSNLSCPKWSL